MNFWEIIYTTANNAGIPTTKLGPKLGLSREYVAVCKSRGVSPSVENAARILSVCGYKLAAIPVDSVPENVLIIEAENDGE